jgi:hypothetical protein
MKKNGTGKNPVPFEAGDAFRNGEPPKVQNEAQGSDYGATIRNVCAMRSKSGMRV